MPEDPVSALHALDLVPYLLMAGTACCAWPPRSADPSSRLERLLLLLLLHATTLVLCNALVGPQAAWQQWRTALLPGLLIGGLLRAGRMPPRPHAGAVSALLGLFWINGVLR